MPHKQHKRRKKHVYRAKLVHGILNNSNLEPPVVTSYNIIQYEETIIHYISWLGFHGRGGYLTVQTPPYLTPLGLAFTQAGSFLGYKPIDLNGPTQTGNFNLDFNLITKDKRFFLMLIKFVWGFPQCFGAFTAAINQWLTIQ